MECSPAYEPIVTALEISIARSVINLNVVLLLISGTSSRSDLAFLFHLLVYLGAAVYKDS
jgi:hypothetical protein